MTDRDPNDAYEHLGAEPDPATLTSVYDDLRQVAQRQIRGPVHVSVGATDLVHEVVTKMLSPGEGPPRLARGHLIALATTAMRNVIVDRARRRGALKRGAAAPLDALPEEPVAGQVAEGDTALFVDEALEALEEVDARSARVVEWTVFGGLSQEEIAEQLGVSERTVRRDWRFARAWLQRHGGLGDGSVPMDPTDDDGLS